MIFAYLMSNWSYIEYFQIFEVSPEVEFAMQIGKGISHILSF